MFRRFSPLAVCLWACATSQEPSEVAVSRSKFSLGSLAPLEGGDSEELIASNTSVASLGRQRATWWVAGVSHSAALPGVPVRGARFSLAGDAILVGPGRLDLATQAFRGELDWLAPEGPPSPAGGRLELHAASWSPDGARAALLYTWVGPSLGARPEPQLRMVSAGKLLAPAPAPGATDVIIVGEHVAVAAPLVSVFDAEGRATGTLPKARGAPVRLRSGLGAVLSIELDGSIRVLDLASAAVVATWPGSFIDASEVPGERALLGVDARGRVHAACLDGSGLRPLGLVETRVLDARIAVTKDRRVILAGAGPVPVVAARLELDCKP